MAAIATFALMIGGCKEKKTVEEKIVATHYIPKRPQGPIAMPVDSQMVNVQWRGSSYNVKIVRTPIDTVSVTDDSGQKYIDNSCRLIVSRKDGSIFVEKSFVKNSFLSYVKEPFRSSGILAGLSFVEADDDRLDFSVVVAMPDAADDLFVQLKMDVDAQGGLRITQDDDMGMLDYEDYDEDEGV